MISRRYFTQAGLALALSGCDLLVSDAGTQRQRSSAHSRLLAEAEAEGALRIDAATGLSNVDNLLASFESAFPGIQLDYRRIVSSELPDIFTRDIDAGGPTADIVISSSMDQQFKLVNDGFAQTYISPEKPFLPGWAVWKDQAYAVTAEPIVFAYNRELMPPEDVPHSHHELTTLLRNKPEEYRGRIATYNPETSGPGYLYYTHDLLLSRDTLDLVQAVGRTDPKFFDTGGQALDRLVSGEYLLAYNMVSSHAYLRQELDPAIDVIFPTDYTLVMSRMAFIPKLARNPASARLFLNFLLSESGQTHMARQHMTPIRNGVTMNRPAPAPEILLPIHFGPSLLANLDEFRRRSVLREWRRALES